MTVAPAAVARAMAASAAHSKAVTVIKEIAAMPLHGSRKYVQKTESM